MALRQLDATHKVRLPTGYPPFRRVIVRNLTDAIQAVSDRPGKFNKYPTPRIISLGGDHTTTLSALRSTYQHWGDVSVIHFDSHIGRELPIRYCKPLTIPPRYLGSKGSWGRHLPLCVSCVRLSRVLTNYPAVESTTAHFCTSPMKKA